MDITSTYKTTNKGVSRTLHISAILRNLIAVLFSIFCLLVITNTDAHAWPAESDWSALVNGTSALGDVEGDGTTSRDIVGDDTYPAAYVFNDGNYIYYRIRLSADPWQSAGQLLRPFGWGFLIDTDQNGDYYEWMVMIDGISDQLYIAENTVKSGTLGDPSDKAEVRVYEEDLIYGTGSENFRTFVTSDTESPTSDFGGPGDPDYFLEFRYPYSTWQNEMGLSDTSIIRYFVGSSNQAQTLSADLVGGSTLYDAITNPILPTGTTPTDGFIYFKEADGITNMTDFYPGATLYIRVEDADQNTINTEAEQITVEITAPSGDSYTLTLTETGLATGIFTGTLATEIGTPDTFDNVLQLAPTELVKVTYLDKVSEDLSKDNSIYVEVTALPSSDLVVSKIVNDTTPDPDQLITYTISVINNGVSDATGVQVLDLLPTGVTYDSDDAGGFYNPATGTWVVGNIADGATQTLIINAIVDTDASGSIENDASILSATQLDPDTSNNSATATIAVGGADLRVTKTVDVTTPGEGDTIVYTITVTNLGEKDATNVVIEDQWPDGIINTPVPSTTNGSYNTGTKLWTLAADLDTNAITNTATLTLTGIVNTGTSGQFATNTALVNSVDQADPNTSNDSDNVVIAIGGADLKMTKSVDIVSPNVGDSVQFTITVENLAGNTASAITVKDVWPSSILNYTAYSTTNGLYSNTTGIWTLAGSLAESESAILYINGTVKSATGGQTATNTAYINSSGQADGNALNNSASASLTVTSADLEISKTVNAPAPNVGQIISYTITVTNNGPNDASEITVIDNLPTDINYVSYSGDGTYVSGTGIWSANDLAVGMSNTLIINATADASANESRTNIASINNATQFDPTSANDSDTAFLSMVGIDMLIEKFISNTSPNTGDTVTFIINATNQGPNIAEGVEISDAEQTGVTFVSDTTTDGTFNTDTWSFGNNHDFAVGQMHTLTITATVTAGTCETVNNTARFISADQTDFDSSNNQDTVSFLVGATDVSLIINTSTPTPSVGNTVTFTLTATNEGTGIANGIEIEDIIDTSKFDNITWSGDGLYVPASGIWNGIDLPSNGLSNSITISAIVNSAAAGLTLTNNAEINSISLGCDINASNDTANESITVQSSDISVFKLADNATPPEGAVLKYTITVTNNGPHDATGIVINDLLDSRLSYINDNGLGNYVTGTGIWNVGDIAKLTSKSLIINTTILPGNYGQNIPNIANITAADVYDSNAVNNSSSYSVTAAVGSTDLSVSMVANTTTPTVGETVSFTISLINNGTVPAASIKMYDLLPSGLTFTGASGDGIYNSTTGIWNGLGVFNASTGRIELYAGITNTIVIYATVDAAAAGLTFNNTALINAVDQSDPDSSNDSHTISITVQSADLSVTKTVNDAAPEEGNNVEYTVTVTNIGPHPSTGVIVTDIMPAGLTYVSDDSGGLYNSVTGDWAIGGIINAASTVIKIITNAPIGTGGNTYTNTAFINTSDIYDGVAGNNTDNVDISPTIILNPVFIITKSTLSTWDPINFGSNPIAIPGALMKYNINVSNFGGKHGESVIINDVLASTLSLRVNQAGGPFTVTNNAWLTSLTYSYVSLGDNSDDVAFDNGSGLYDYTPVADANGMDSNVRAFSISFGGIFNATAGANTPTMNIEFETRIK
jgi:uncharacterized repeat protein (TIGR01451 family)